MDKVRVGFVGAGFMGQLAHLSNFVMLGEKCDVVALAEPREELARAVAAKYGIPKVYRDHRELCEDPDIEAVVEITPDGLHVPVALEVIDSGKHVMMEKPIATCSDDARKAVEAARSKGVKLMVGYMKRYDPGVERAKLLLDELRSSGELGEVVLARAHCLCGDWTCGIESPVRTDEPAPDVTPRLPDWLPPERAEEFLSFNNVFCHNFNLLRFLVGEVKGIKFADLSGPVKLVVLDMGGYTATLELGGISAHKWEEHTQVYFSHGWVRVETPPPMLRQVPAKVEIYKDRDIREVVMPLPEWGWSFYRQAEHFLDCVLEDKEPRSSGEDSLRDMELIEETFRRFLIERREEER